MPWIAGTDGMAVGDVVKFKATVVRSHSTWHAFETTFEVGSARGAGFAAIALERGRAPGSDDGGTSGVRAPGMAAATLGGWREPPAGTTEGGGQKMGKVVIDAKVAARRRRERSRKEREESRREDVQKAREILGGFGGSAVKAPTAEKPAVEAPTTDAAALVAARGPPPRRAPLARLLHGVRVAPPRARVRVRRQARPRRPDVVRVPSRRVVLRRGRHGDERVVYRRREGGGRRRGGGTDASARTSSSASRSRRSAGTRGSGTRGGDGRRFTERSGSRA